VHDKADTTEAIITAMATLGADADAKTIAQAADLGYSTVTKKLRALADAGRVQRTDTGEGPALWRRTDATDPAGPAQAAPEQAQHSDTPPTQPSVPIDSSGQSTPPPADHADHQDEPIPDSTAPTAEGATPVAAASAGGRRAKGQLRDAVLKLLQDNPDQQYSPTQVSKLLDGASQGAIRNNLHALTIHGVVRLTREKPERFQAV
jgi:Fe2+ or Zn2+ uptake regulation protein